MYKEVIEVGFFNEISGLWLAPDRSRVDYQLEIGDVVFIMVVKDASVLGGVYSKLTNLKKETNTILHDVFISENDNYVIKNDKFRMKFKNLTRKKVKEISSKNI